VVELGAIFDGDAGDFDGDGRRGGGAQLANAGGLRGGRRAFEALRENSLHEIAELAAQREKGGLRAVPGNKPGGIDGKRQIIHDVNAGGSCHAGGSNVQGDEDRAALGVGHGGAIVKRRIGVALARLDDLESLGFERGANLRGELENDVTFVDAAGATRAEVGAAVSGVEHHDVEPGALRRRNLRGARGRWRGGLRGSWLC